MYKDLINIVKSFNNPTITGNIDKQILELSLNSNDVKIQTMFFAIVGDKTDGHKYIKQAQEKGASTIVCNSLPENIDKSITYIQVEDTYIALASACKVFFNDPSSKMKVVAITGTNGKTTIATLLYDMFMLLNHNSGLISTIENKICKKIIPTQLTTPDVLTINKLMNEMVENNCEYCFMEASSHAIVQNRIYGIDIDIACFTNLTHEHLDYHKEFSEYLKAKKLLFDNLKQSGTAITNIDDKNGKVMVQNCKATIKTYSLKSASDIKVKIIEPHFDGTLLNIENSEVWVSFIGEFNAYNLLAVYGVAITLEISHDNTLLALSKLNPVSGRFEVIRSSNNICGIIDYAHSPDALENVLKTISNLRNKEEKIITVVGCGGDRDKTKRPEMAAIARKYSDKVILTSDNPRTENPEQIIKDMEEGIKDNSKNIVSITNRGDAIKTAYMLATENDIILIAGKGHETYQEVNGVRNHFDDKEQLLNNFD